MIRLGDLFTIKYPSTLVFGHQVIDPKGIPFVTSKGTNNGVAGRVRPIAHADLYPSNTITVPLKGTVMWAHLQPESFYCAHQIAVLLPPESMTLNQILYYVQALRANKYRFNYGRQADRTLRDILVPDLNEIPSWVNIANLDCCQGAEKPATADIVNLDVKTWRLFKYKDLFHIERGRGPRKKDLNGKGKYPFVSASEFNNGITDYSDMEPFHKPGVITVARNGNSVASAFYQETAFHSTEDVHVFTPRFNLTKHVALFICTLIKKERYRYSYGRKWGITRMNETDIKLPVTSDNTPDFDFMERYIKTLPYSSQIL